MKKLLLAITATLALSAPMAANATSQEVPFKTFGDWGVYKYQDEMTEEVFYKAEPIEYQESNYNSYSDDLDPFYLNFTCKKGSFEKSYNFVFYRNLVLDGNFISWEDLRMISDSSFKIDKGTIFTNKLIEANNSEYIISDYDLLYSKLKDDSKNLMVKVKPYNKKHVILKHTLNGAKYAIDYATKLCN